ncbi:helix-turn-helix domain-containing protein [Clostridium cadaveris]|uniref:Helix-turn-helix domain-containing protein n=1 Tax=Clostridium cadaveris TaxID=1529 RepID=A0A1I2JTW9_9CLOT|nr:helix-turn-helix domain-containing protein [Clostridium cadaveris]SFF57483.1 Helix-turn-helix domain-containing protein [Clostridium cadaveris]
MESKLKQNNIVNRLLKFSVIVEASNADIDAINEVLKHYESYICKLSLSTIYDDVGNSYMTVDQYMRSRLETKLITKVLEFRVA